MVAGRSWNLPSRWVRNDAITRRAVLATAASVPLGAGAGGEWPRTISDLAGRRVVVSHPPRAVLLGEGLLLVALSLIHPDPVSILSSSANDLQRREPPLFEAFRDRFPPLASVVPLGPASPDSLALERALAAAPDLALLSRWQIGSDLGRAMLGRLEAAGVPTVVVDFFTHPLADTGPSMRVLGRALGHDAAAEDFANFHAGRVARVSRAVRELAEPAPVALVHAYPGLWDCCWAVGGAGFGEFIDLAGGNNLAASLVPPGGATLSLELVVARAPKVYVATGLAGGPGAAPGEARLRIGPGVAPEEARRSLGDVLRTPGLAGLPAVQSGRAYAIWNFFNAVPLNLLAVEAMAGWFHPALAASIDPVSTLAEINRRFAAVPFSGSYWTNLDVAAAAGEAR